MNVYEQKLDVTRELTEKYFNMMDEIHNNTTDSDYREGYLEGFLFEVYEDDNMSLEEYTEDFKDYLETTDDVYVVDGEGFILGKGRLG